MLLNIISLSILNLDSYAFEYYQHNQSTWMVRLLNIINITMHSTWMVMPLTVFGITVQLESDRVTPFNVFGITIQLGWLCRRLSSRSITIQLELDSYAVDCRLEFSYRAEV